MQIGKDCDQQELVALFSKFGAIESVSLLGNRGGNQAGYAFVQYEKWAACEAAIEALDGKHIMPGSDIPVVVKFADAKRHDANDASNGSHSTALTDTNFRSGDPHPQQSPVNSGKSMGSVSKRNANANATPLSATSTPLPLQYHGAYQMALPGMLQMHGPYLTHPSDAMNHFSMASSGTAAGHFHKSPQGPYTSRSTHRYVGMPSGVRSQPGRRGNSSMPVGHRQGLSSNEGGSSDSLAEKSESDGCEFV